MNTIKESELLERIERLEEMNVSLFNRLSRIEGHRHFLDKRRPYCTREPFVVGDDYLPGGYDYDD